MDPRTLRTHPELHSQVSFPLFQTLGEKPKGPLEKFLSIFADVRAGEGITAVLLIVNFFVLLGCYYLLKPAREALILVEGGAEVKAYAAAGQAAVLLVLIPIYGWIATHVNRFRLVAGATLFFVMNLLLFWFFGTQGVKEGVVFYIWLGIFNMFVISQYWAFANDIYTEGQGRRLFPIIGIGSSLGAWLGSTSAAGLVKKMGLTPYQLMLAGAVVLLIPVVILYVVNRRETRRADAEVAKEAEAPLGPEGGFQLILRDRYLFWIAVLILVLNVVNTSGEYILSKLVVSESLRVIGPGDALAAERGRFIGGFYGDFFGWVNLLGFLLQSLAVSRVMRYAGVRGALFVLPVLAVISYSFLAGAPILAVVRVIKVLENATDYSLMNTVRQALWLPVSREAKYKAKAAVDSFIVRTGDMLQAGIVYAGVAIGLGIQGFAALNVALTILWLYAAWQIRRLHRRLTV